MSESEGLLLMSDDLAAILGANALPSAPAGAESRVSRLRCAPLVGGGTRISFRTTDSELVSRVVSALGTHVDLALACGGLTLRTAGRATSARVRTHEGGERALVVCVASSAPK